VIADDLWQHIYTFCSDVGQGQTEETFVPAYLTFDQNSVAKLQQLRNTTMQTIRLTKAEIHKNTNKARYMLNNASNRHDSKRFYRWITGSKKTRDDGIKVLKTKAGEISSDPEDVAQTLHQFYEDLFSAPPSEHTHSYQGKGSENNETDGDIRPVEWEAAIRHMKANKSPGNDMLRIRIRIRIRVSAKKKKRSCQYPPWSF